MEGVMCRYQYTAALRDCGNLDLGVFVKLTHLLQVFRSTRLIFLRMRGIYPGQLIADRFRSAYP
ncbi:hypothetical protein D3C73_1622730 [compost metagenome]